MSFERAIFRKLNDDLKDPRITILFGARQVGKTYLMKEIAKSSKQDYKYFNLENFEDLRLFNAEPEEILALLQGSASLVFLDEFHYVENISKIFKVIFDIDSWDSKQDHKIYASGSSAIEMHKHIKESLAGRFKKYLLRPLSFDEFCSNTDLEISFEHALTTFLSYGGLPGVYSLQLNPTNTDKQSYLEGILNSYIQKDVKSLVAEENLAAFNNLLYILADNQGQLLSVSNLAREVRVSSPTLENYISILEQTYVLYTLKSYSGNLSNELKKSKKYYLYDLGIRNALLKDFSSYEARKDKGSILESFVYHYLLSIYEPSDTDIFFWRTSAGLEIDFIWSRNRVPVPIEVKSKLNKAEVPKAFQTFFKAYANASFALVINENLNEVCDFHGKQVYFVSIQEIDRIKQLLL